MEINELKTAQPFIRRPDLFPKDKRIAFFIIHLWNDTFQSDLDQLAFKQDLSISRLRALCQKEKLPSPGKLRRILTIEKVKELLESTDQSLIEITFVCGFQSQQNFNSTFKIETGMSPLVYRKLYNKEC